MSNYSEEESCQNVLCMEEYSTEHGLFKLNLKHISPTPTIKIGEGNYVTERFEEFCLNEKEPQILSLFRMDHRESPLWSLEQILESNLSQKKQQKHLYPRDCKVCGTRFSTPQGFGGHNAKKHPGKSESYNLKKSTEKSRVLKRKRGTKLGQIINKSIY